MHGRMTAPAVEANLVNYLWPLLITTNRSMETIVIGIVKMIGTSDAQTDWNLIMATAVLAMLPPVAVVVFMQHWFVKGLALLLAPAGAWLLVSGLRG